MEFEKNMGKVSFGFGTMTAAGKGKLSDAEKIPADRSPQSIAKNALKTGLKAGALTAAFMLRHRAKKK